MRVSPWLEASSSRSVTSPRAAGGSAKVLGSYPEEGVAFLRTYAQRFPTPPDSIDPTSLRVGTFDDPDGPTIRCAPIRYESVRDDWLASPDYGRLPITEEELDSVRETIQMMEDDA